MAFKISKGKTVDNLDLRLSDPQTENEIIKLRKENAYLKKSLDELSHQKGEPSDSENNKLLLERILALETLREKNSQQILSRDQEIASLRQQLRSSTAEVVASLQAQLNQQNLDAEMRENLFLSLKQETEVLKTKLVVISARCQDLENTVEPVMGGMADGLSADRDVAVLQDHLNDALEKNQQWLAYDQQREAYVRTVVERTQQLERQLEQANKAFQQKDREAHSEASLQRHVDLLHTAHAELEEEQEKAEERRHCEEEQREAKRQVEEERRRVAEHFKHLRTALDDTRAKLGEEKLRSSMLLEQVNHFQKILLSQQDDQKQISVLEQQIQASAKDLEDEKRDNHHLQRHLHKVLKELRKAKDRVARSECERSRTEAPSSSKATKGGPKSPTSPTKAQGLLDESFLECPNCRAQYPTSHHRELLVHIDQCFD